MRTTVLKLACVALAACTPATEFPEASEWSLTGPGGPARSFTSAELWQECVGLVGGEQDVEHHNMVGMVDGYLLMPWVPEDGGGGLTFYDFTDPCAPVKVGEAFSDRFRETHTVAVGEVGGRRLLAVDSIREEGDFGGLGLWDITDPTAPFWLSDIDLPGFDYPDAYFFVSLSATFVGDLVYVSAGFLGLFAVDVSDPENPEVVMRYEFEGDAPMLVGATAMVGDVGLAFNAGTAPTWVLDLSSPLDPEPLAYFETEASDADTASYYFATLGGKYGLFARKGSGGGPIVYDLSDPLEPAFVADHHTADGDGGYVFRHEDALFLGDSNFGSVYDFSDPTSLVELQRLYLPGDLDTLTPVGNVVVLSVDSGADPGRGSVVVPWREEPDARPPRAEWLRPADLSENVAPTTRIGVSFDEMIESASVFRGSFRVTDRRGVEVPGRFNAQESTVNFTPDEPLLPGKLYRVTLPVGGIADASGNPLDEEVSWSFRVASE
ncbi:MAG: hypothetical protein EP330_19445 [Deltaproteobacteria bacterium]|nr:MAG: hypothetical protein EP330_19445 [Deltaproteobacteria bacterium]